MLIPSQIPNEKVFQSMQKRPEKLAPSAPSKHLDYLDSLRALAALYVVLHHAWLQTWPVDLYSDAVLSPLLMRWTGRLTYGHYAVTFFITLSGFCLMIPVLRAGHLRGGPKGFAIGRIRRILPPYYAALLLSTIIALFFLRYPTHTLYDLSLPVTAKGFLLHLFLIHNLTSLSTQINGPLWSIAVESQIYILFPILVWIWVRKGILPILGLTAIISIPLWYLVHNGPQHDLTPHYLFIFGLGMFAAIESFRYEDRDASAANTRRIAIAGGGILLVYVLFHHYFRAFFRFNYFLNDFIFGLVSAVCLVIVTTGERNVLRRFASWRPIAWIGGFSYSLYLIHFPLQQLFWQVFVQPYRLSKVSGFLIVSIAGTLVLLPISWIFYRIFEKPFMRSKPKA